MNKIWTWLDGKKTSIGAVLLIICGAPHLEQWISPDILDIVYYVGSVLGAGGVIHKVAKSSK